MTRRQAPVATIGLALAAIVVALVPTLQRWLVLDRAAVGTGQLWRVATGSLVHFSASHLVLDLLAVGIPGAMLESRGRHIGGAIVLASVAVGVAVLALDPALALYGGLSGVAYALVVLAALDGATSKGIERAAALAVLALTVAKLWWEMRSGSFLLVHGAAGSFVPVPVSHLAGSVAGAATFLWWHRPPAPTTRAAVLSRTATIG